MTASSTAAAALGPEQVYVEAVVADHRSLVARLRVRKSASFGAPDDADR